MYLTQREKHQEIIDYFQDAMRIVLVQILVNLVLKI